MEGFDKFIWFILVPGFFTLATLLSVLTSHLPIPSKLIIIFVFAMLAFVLYPMQVNYLIKRRRMWGP